jgi:hypothetical protein
MGWIGLVWEAFHALERGVDNGSTTGVCVAGHARRSEPAGIVPPVLDQSRCRLQWLARWQAGDQELVDRSRRPHVTPTRSEAVTEAQVLAIRDKHPSWGARKIAHCLKRDGSRVPVPSTVHQILCRNGRVKPTENAPPNPGHRFEKEAPNLLWQMDFKGHMPFGQRDRLPPVDHGRRSFPLCIVFEGLRQRTTADGTGPSDSYLPALWPARCLLHRQRFAMG